MPPKRKRSSEFDKEESAEEPSSINDELEDNNVIQARENDCLFGRGDSINRHPGNKKFRELVDAHKKTYLSSRFKQEKRMIADSIMQKIQNLNPPGRFLAKAANGQWEIVGEARAREKTLQALREKARTVRTQAEAREPPRPSLPPEPSWGLQQYYTTTEPRQAAYEGGRGMEGTSSSGSSGLSLVQAINSSTASLSAGLPPAHPNAASTGPSAPLPLPAGFVQTLDLEAISSFLASLPSASLAAITGGEASVAALDSQVNTMVAPLPNMLRNPAGTDVSVSRPPSPSSQSQSSNNTAPMAPPPALPTSVVDIPGNTVVQELSSLLMSPRSPNEERSNGLMLPPPARPMQEPPQTSAATNIPFTPRTQVQNMAVGCSPFSSGTFAALHRLAFPESPNVDHLLSGSDRPFSPRRLPPDQNPCGTWQHEQQQEEQQSTTQTFASPQVPPASLRRLTPHPRKQQELESHLHPAPEMAYLRHSTNPPPESFSLQAQNLLLQQSQQGYSPLPVHTGPLAEAPTPPADSPFGRQFDLLRFLEEPAEAPLPSPSALDRSIPLPRASLSRRASHTTPMPRREASPTTQQEDSFPLSYYLR